MDVFVGGPFAACAFFDFVGLGSAPKPSLATSRLNSPATYRWDSIIIPGASLAGGIPGTTHACERVNECGLGP
jgi:hypothetical protein